MFTLYRVAKQVYPLILSHFDLMFHFYTSWKRQGTFGFLIFSGGIGMEHWAKIS